MDRKIIEGWVLADSAETQCQWHGKIALEPSFMNPYSGHEFVLPDALEFKPVSGMALAKVSYANGNGNVIIIDDYGITVGQTNESGAVVLQYTDVPEHAVPLLMVKAQLCG